MEPKTKIIDQKTKENVNECPNVLIKEPIKDSFYWEVVHLIL